MELLIFLLILAFFISPSRRDRFFSNVKRIDTLNVLRFLNHKLPLLLIRLIAAGSVISVLINREVDTTEITTSAIIGLAALAALSFSFVQTSKGYEFYHKIRSRGKLNSEVFRTKIFSAGMGFFSAAIVLSVASILKYASLHPPTYFPTGSSIEGEYVRITFAFSFIAFIAGVLRAAHSLEQLYLTLEDLYLF
jgi:hypothetical protein